MLKRAAWCAAGLVALIVAGVVMPAETGQDPTGLGTVLGLTEMGRIKVALAQEAADEAQGTSLVANGADAGSTSNTAPVANAPTADGGWRDSITITLEPSKGIELKLTMQQGDTARYTWTTDSAEVYYHRHGEPPNAARDAPAHTYDKGMAVTDQGNLIAAFDGIHGWFFRNRSTAPMRVTLRTRGTYTSLDRM